MSLPTPPSTRNRDKENVDIIGGSRVAWSLNNQYHSLQSPPKPRVSSSTYNTPTRSILKKPSQLLLPLPDVAQREITPEPADALANLTYLEYPISKIVAVEGSLREQIEGYNVLAARLRTSVPESAEADSSWPLFQPLRRQQQRLVDCIVRDLGRALEDPGCLELSELLPEDDREAELSLASLPSPKSTPKKKKRGMTAEQVKHARDLCTVTHSVLKVLSLVFSSPPIQKVFTDEQLGSILTQILAIPLAEEVPTPNARKTCALAIWLLQVQRLPEEVLMPARDRIACALRRGMDGELGKEGKKGSASDGLKAIHDLCLYQPLTFAPAFAPLLPSILANILAPTLPLRTQACHALGGFVLGMASLPLSYIHTHVADCIASFLLTVPAASKRTSPSKNASPTKASQESIIVRTLRTTLNATEAAHVAQGPVWALCVMASFIVLLGSSACLNIKLTRTIYGLLSVAIRHKKSSIRALACIVWRCMTWAYLQPSLPPIPDEESVEPEQDNTAAEEAARANFWKLLKSCIDLQAGVATIAGLLGAEDSDDESLNNALTLIKLMLGKGSRTCLDAVDTLQQLVSLDPSPRPWHPNRLVTRSLFSASPGLLTVDFANLSEVVQPLYAEAISIEDVRPLAREEIVKDWVYAEFLELWKLSIGMVEMFEDTDMPAQIVGIWDGLLKAQIGLFQDNDEDDAIPDFAAKMVDVLIELLQDTNLDLVGRSTSATAKGSAGLRGSSPFNFTDPPMEPAADLTNGLLKLHVVRRLFETTRAAIPHVHMNMAGERMLACLMKNEDEFTEGRPAVLGLWARFCAEVIAVCDIDLIKAFWGYMPALRDKIWEWNWTDECKAVAWRAFLQKWREDPEANWEGCLYVLGVPFMELNGWELTSDDLTIWEEFLTHTIGKGLDCGNDTLTVLDNVAEIIQRHRGGNNILASARVADLLLSQVDLTDVQDSPKALVEYTGEVLVTTYPPHDSNNLWTMWLIRSVVQAIGAASSPVLDEILQTWQDGLWLWITDAERACVDSKDDLITLYEAILVAIQGLPVTAESIESMVLVLGSVFASHDKLVEAGCAAFTEFWNTISTYLIPPEEGWSSSMLRILSLAGLLPEEIPAPAEVAECEEVATLIEDSHEPEEETPLHDHHSSSPCIGHFKPASFASPSPSPSPSPVEPCAFNFGYGHGPEVAYPIYHPSSPPIPTTPLSSSTSFLFTPRASTPTRPQKPMQVGFEIPSKSPGSPSVRRSRMERNGPGERANVLASPNKRRRVTENEDHDKENSSPYRLSSAPRSGSTLVGSSPSVRGKKRRASFGEDVERPIKRGKTGKEVVVQPSESETESDTEEEVAQEKGTAENPILVDLFGDDDDVVVVPRSAGESAANGGKPKTVRMFMEAVEVPRLKEVYKRMSKPLAEVLGNAKTLMTPRGPALKKKAASTIKAKSSTGIKQSTNVLGDANSRKRRRNSDSGKHHDVAEITDDDDDPFTIKALTDTNRRASMPVRPLPALQIPGCDGPIVLEATSPSLSVRSRSRTFSPVEPHFPSSSDDDPHLGQVTPHHLISPALRRTRAIPSMRLHSSERKKSKSLVPSVERLLGSDPPSSDDSVLSASPSREIVRRRTLKRTGSTSSISHKIKPLTL
ncbi:hypothetical protein BDN72DRAFT_959500 [Pluteus cervinus]|uniref:Uncharacterized protein n=1 Tax=Pluteus cervinus TaxID=181527 RepID=A0ACD3AV14_9AGAR|nr:hypothetical protein BDN72DRAFT_959500 [Pluteus cervinus]